MILYLQATTNVQDLVIDYIEVKLKSGKTASLNWDESGINRSETGFDARYKGVYFDEEYTHHTGTADIPCRISDSQKPYGVRTEWNADNGFHFQTFIDRIFFRMVFLYLFDVENDNRCTGF